MKEVKNLVEYDGEDKIIDSLQLRSELEESGQNVVFRVSSQFPRLEELLQGFEPPELVVVSGPRKSGKTLFMQTLTYHFQDKENFPCWFQFENTPIQFLRTFESNGLPYFLLPRKLKTAALDWFEERVYEAILKYRTRVFIIDHLHFLVDMARSGNMSLEIGQVMRQLKTIAKEYNIIIFLMCHLKKTKFDQEPDDSDFRDSSFISQESDVGVMIWRKKNSDQAVLKVSYSRRTGVLEQKILLEKKGGLLVEVETSRLEPKEYLENSGF